MEPGGLPPGITVTSLVEIEDLLRRCWNGETARGEVYVIVGSLEVSEAEAMKTAVDELQSRFSVDCPNTVKAKLYINNMFDLHTHLVATERHVDFLLHLADGFKIKLKEEEDDEMVKLAEEAERTNQRLGRKQVERVLQRKAKAARVRSFQAKADEFRKLRSMAQRASRLCKAGDQLGAELDMFHFKSIRLVAAILSGKNTIDWVITALANLNESVLPNLRNFTVQFDTPAP